MVAWSRSRPAAFPGRVRNQLFRFDWFAKFRHQRENSRRPFVAGVESRSTRSLWIRILRASGNNTGARRFSADASSLTPKILYGARSQPLAKNAVYDGTLNLGISHRPPYHTAQCDGLSPNRSGAKSRSPIGIHSHSGQITSPPSHVGDPEHN